ncbi:MAG TPA: hypothetical protein PK852_02435 [Mesotoga prima]|uniref:hypothetical protein n=1 Tax=Mesotoga prima TaxID=1184387 RepID=UPI002C6CC644|nr:hypothetical protein [Mesotoga prima]HPE52952.1 hypothetical protein [Mesotoga prima]
MAGTRRNDPVEAVSKPESLVEVADSRDVSPRAKVDTTGQRVKATPFSHGLEVVVREKDFLKGGIKHGEVRWHFQRDNFTVKVGEGLTKQAADYLVKSFPSQFQYVGGK